MDNHKKRKKHKISDLQMLLFMLYEKDWCPAIVFAFSKREVEHHAMVCNFYFIFILIIFFLFFVFFRH